MKGQKLHGSRSNLDHAADVKRRNQRAGTPASLVIRNRPKRKRKAK